MKIKKKVLFLLPFLSTTLGCFHQANKSMGATLSSPSLENSLQKARASQLFSSLSLDEPWWNSFQDLQLKNLINQALAASPTLQKAEAKVMQAQAAAKEIRGNLFPQLGANASDTWAYLSKYGLFRDFFPKVPGFPVPSKFNETDLSLNFSYEIDFWGKNRKMLKSALGLALAEEMERKQTTLLLSTTIAFTYFSWQSHFAQLILYKKQLACEEEILALLEKRYQIGIDKIIPSLEKTENTLSLLQKIEEVEKNLALDEIFLKNLLGEGPEVPLELVFAWDPSKQQSYLPDTLEIDLLAKRPDVMAQILRVEAAKDETFVAKTEFYPNINLMALGGLSSLSFSRLFDFSSRTGALHPAIHLPLFTGGKLQANLQGKVALFNEAVYSYNELLLKAAQEVVSELTTFLSIQNQMEEQKKKLQIEEQLFSVSVSSFDQGIGTYTKVLLSKKDFLEKEIYEVQLQEYKILSTLRIIKAVGGGITTHKDIQ